MSVAGFGVYGWKAIVKVFENLTWLAQIRSVQKSHNECAATADNVFSSGEEKDVAIVSRNVVAASYKCFRPWRCFKKTCSNAWLPPSKYSKRSEPLLSARSSGCLFASPTLQPRGK